MANKLLVGVTAHMSMAELANHVKRVMELGVQSETVKDEQYESRKALAMLRWNRLAKIALMN